MHARFCCVYEQCWCNVLKTRYFSLASRALSTPTPGPSFQFLCPGSIIIFGPCLWTSYKLALAISSGDSPVCCTVIRIKTGFVMLAKISVARHKRETNHSKLLCPCTAPFSIQPWQDGSFLAKIRSAFGWVSGPYSFSAAKVRSFLSILERGACSPPGPGFRRAWVYIGQ